MKIKNAFNLKLGSELEVIWITEECPDVKLIHQAYLPCPDWSIAIHVETATDGIDQFLFGTLTKQLVKLGWICDQMLVDCIPQRLTQ